MIPEVACQDPRRSRAECLQHNGRRMVVAGFFITVVGVVLYCLACFAGGYSADMGDLLLQNAVPFGRATLAVLGLGTVTWLVGSFTYLRGSMETDAEHSATGTALAH